MFKVTKSWKKASLFYLLVIHFFYFLAICKKNVKKWGVPSIRRKSVVFCPFSAWKRDF